MKKIINNEFENLIKQTKKRENKKKEQIDKVWLIKIIIIAFFVSLILSLIASTTISNLSLILGIIITIVFIIFGIIFDIIGVAVTTADEKVFHSMNSRKVKGAALAVLFKKKADKVSNFCSDVIGDICGVVSGAAGTTIATILINKYHTDILLTGLLITAIISAITIGGRAIGKSLAINKGNIILYEFAKILSIFYKI